MNKYQKFKRRVFDIIQSAKEGDIASKVFDMFIISLIILNVIIVMAETFNLPDDVSKVLSVIDTVSVIIFTAEYALRIWTANYMYPECGPIKSRIKYIFSFMAIIDLLAILPFYLPFAIPIDLRVLRILRVLRLFRVFKVSRYTNAFAIMAEVFKKKASQLISSILVVFLLIVMASIVMYNIENSAQPDTFSNVFEAMWWAVATLTTVGYGDIYPITVLGKILSTVIAFLGIGLVAVPTGIITAGFNEVSRSRKYQGQFELVEDEKEYCPYCGHYLNK